MANVSVTFEEGARAIYAPDFLDRCIRIANSFDEEIGPISLRFRQVHLVLMGAGESSLLSASVAWRNEIFALLHAPLDQPAGGLGVIELSDPERRLYNHSAYSEDQAKSELRVLLRILLKAVLKKHELRVKYAREALDILEPGHAPGLVHR